MKGAIVSVVCIVLLVIVAKECEGSKGFLWTGFDHGWLRHPLSFETPHRMGTLGNLLTTSNTTQTSSQAKGLASQSFTPGVNGDYAHPATHYVAWQVADGSVRVDEEEITFNFSDSASEHGPHQALSSISFSSFFSIPPTSTGSAPLHADAGIYLSIYLFICLFIYLFIYLC